MLQDKKSTKCGKVIDFTVGTKNPKEYNLRYFDLINEGIKSLLWDKFMTGSFVQGILHITRTSLEEKEYRQKPDRISQLDCFSLSSVIKRI